MRYLSLCSGIEAASVAWAPMGWECVGVAEIEAFPSAVLAHHYPGVPNFGDLTNYGNWPDSLRPDCIVAGTPCQAFSVAGLRQGLADPRGNLSLVFLGVLERYRPRWVVWENVPGVLSDQTGAFGALLGGLGELGYGFAYRVLDAQYFGVAQRRRRVFVVGHLGDWRAAAAVLFEPESLSGDPAPRREAGERSAPTLAARTRGGGGLGTDCELDGGLIPSVAHALRGEGFDASEDGTGRGTPLVPAVLRGHGDYGDGLPCLRASGGDCHGGSEALVPEVVGALCADSHPGSYTGQDATTGRLIPLAFNARQDPDSWEDRTGPLDTNGWTQAVAFAIQAGAIKENPAHGPDGVGVRADGVSYTLEARAEVQAVAFSCKDYGGDAGETAPTLRSMGHDGSHANGGGQLAVAFGVGENPDLAHCLRSGASKADKHESTTYVKQAMAVRRLTPRECERLQGFPDDYTRIAYRGKRAEDCPDGPRYKALGNSMAVPVMRWIGEGIEAVEKITAGEQREH